MQSGWIRYDTRSRGVLAVENLGFRRALRQAQMRAEAMYCGNSELQELDWESYVPSGRRLGQHAAGRI